MDRRFDPERHASLLQHVRQDEEGRKRKANAGDFSAGLACDRPTAISFVVISFFHRDNEKVPDRIRIFRSEEKSVDQIVDVDQMVEVLSRADHDEKALPDRLEQLQQPSIPRSVRFRDSDDDNGNFLLEGKHDVFSLKLRNPIDIVRLNRGAFVDGSLHRRPVDADRAPVDEPLDACAHAGLEKIGGSLYVYIPKPLVRYIHLVLGRGEMIYDIDAPHHSGKEVLLCYGGEKNRAPFSSRSFLLEDSAGVFSCPRIDTECPPARHRNPNLDPMNPVPPVISTFT